MPGSALKLGEVTGGCVFRLAAAAIKQWAFPSLPLENLSTKDVGD